MKYKYILLVVIIVALKNQFASAQVTFQKTFAGSGVDAATDAQLCSDGGYIITGFIQDTSTGDFDVLLIKTDANGDTIWTNSYGGADDDGGRAVKQTSDGGFIVTCFSASFNDHMYLIKTDANGNLLWSKTYGSTARDEGTSIFQNSDDGYIISANSFSGSNSVFIIRTNLSGDTLWTKRDFLSGLGASIFSVQQTDDGGFIFCGEMQGVISTSPDVLLIKTDANGDSVWTKSYSYSGIGHEYGTCIKQTTDGGYIVSGRTYRSGFGGDDVYLLKVNSNGDLTWSMTYGGTSDDEAYSVDQTNDGGYIVAGKSTSFGIGDEDAYLIKTDSTGIMQWSKVYGDTNYNAARSVRQSSDGGFMISGYSTNQGSSVYLIKTDSFGNSGCNEGSPATHADTITTITGSGLYLFPSGGSVNNPPTLVTKKGLPVQTICSGIGINEIDGEYSKIIFPNPFTNEFTISSTNENEVIELFSVTGNLILKKHASAGQTRIAVENLSPGFYLITCSNKSRSVTIKLAKF